MISTASCPKCGSYNELQPCQNCGNRRLRLGVLTDGSQGWICDTCNLGWSHYSCLNGCGALIPAIAFGTSISRTARDIEKGIQAYQGNSSCFIATEIYGNNSVEVNLLREFRDHTMLPNRLGEELVAIYYRISPSIIPIMRRSGLVRFVLGKTVALSVNFVRWVSYGSKSRSQ